LLSAAYLGLTGCKETPGSLGSKNEWSILESTASKHKKTPLEGLVFLDVEGYHLVGIPFKGRNIWIMLNPASVPYYKQMPHAKFSLSNSDFERVRGTHYATFTVLECLSSHMDDGQ
jgi:hypothetical protein